MNNNIYTTNLITQKDDIMKVSTYTTEPDGSLSAFILPIMIVIEFTGTLNRDIVTFDGSKRYFKTIEEYNEFKENAKMTNQMFSSYRIHTSTRLIAGDDVEDLLKQHPECKGNVVVVTHP